jgi:hypothetical protein
LFHVPEKIIELSPLDPDLPQTGAVSYMGVPLFDADRRILGHLAVLDDKPMPDDPRAAAELRRLQAAKWLKEREEKLTRLVDSTMDAIIDPDLSRILHPFRIHDAHLVYPF